MSSTERSAALFERARALMPGGVNSPVRAFAKVGGTPSAGSAPTAMANAATWLASIVKSTGG